MNHLLFLGHPPVQTDVTYYSHLFYDLVNLTIYLIFISTLVGVCHLLVLSVKFRIGRFKLINGAIFQNPIHKWVVCNLLFCRNVS